MNERRRWTFSIPDYAGVGGIFVLACVIEVIDKVRIHFRARKGQAK